MKSRFILKIIMISLMAFQAYTVKPFFNGDNSNKLAEPSHMSAMNFVELALVSLVVSYCMYNVIKYIRARGFGSNPGTPHDDENKDVEEPEILLDPQKTQECAICFDDKPEQDCCTLACGHTYCKNCLENMIDMAIREKNTTTLVCPSPECKAQIEEPDIRKITDNNLDKMSSIADITTLEWLAKQSDMKQCPTPDCSYAFINDEQREEMVLCPQCEREYCSNCLFLHSEHISCQRAEEKRKLSKNANEANRLAEEWKKKNTKACPNCNRRIEKNGGCNHVTCVKCKHEFCWDCMRPYWDSDSESGFHLCPSQEEKYKDPDDAISDDLSKKIEEKSNAKNSSTLLHLAISQGNYDIAKKLIESSEDISLDRNSLF